MGREDESTDALVNEFVHLNRRRILRGAPLAIAELERWATLRAELRERVGDRLGSLLASVERRSDLRFPTRLSVRFTSGDELREAVLANISRGGIFVATSSPLPEDTPVRLFVSAPHGEVEMAGRVAWVREKDKRDGPAGMGVRFEDLSAEQSARIAEILARLASRPRG
jgi:uncharacterized protein (TIGR02266 family)